MTGNDSSSAADEFEDKMSTYAFYYLYIAAVVLVAGYLQVLRKPHLVIQRALCFKLSQILMINIQFIAFSGYRI